MTDKITIKTNKKTATVKVTMDLTPGELMALTHALHHWVTPIGADLCSYLKNAVLRDGNMPENITDIVLDILSKKEVA